MKLSSWLGGKGARRMLFAYWHAILATGALFWLVLPCDGQAARFVLSGGIVTFWLGAALLLPWIRGGFEQDLAPRPRSGRG